MTDQGSQEISDRIVILVQSYIDFRLLSCARDKLDLCSFLKMAMNQLMRALSRHANLANSACRRPVSTGSIHNSNRIGQTTVMYQSGLRYAHGITKLFLNYQAIYISNNSLVSNSLVVVVK